MKYNTELCKDDMTFQECELAILRNAIDKSGDKIREKSIIRNQNIKDIIKCLEEFLVRKKLVCYGGTAINNILPKEAQFYDYTKEIPDYDFYSPNALDDAIELANIYHKKGYAEVEAKAGVHYGTFKVYVDFTPIADITLMPKEIFKNIQANAKKVAGIFYCPPDFLRMNMYLELSRPLGDVTRWEKVFKRLSLLNKYYPLNIDYNCNGVDFQRKMGKELVKKNKSKTEESTDEPPEEEVATENSFSNIQEKIYLIVRDSFINEGVVFFGGYASSIYSKYMPLKQRKIVQKIPDFDVLSEEPIRVCTIVKERLEENGINKVKIIKRDHIGEIIPTHYEIRIGEDILAHIYEPLACHSYNEIEIADRTIRIGTIDTLLTFYLSFIYVKKPYYYVDRILCMAKFLFDVQQENRLAQTGILKRFSIDCIGNQPSLDDIRIEKADQFKKLMNKKGTREYNMWFLKYKPELNTTPVINEEETNKPKNKTQKKKKKSKNKTVKEDDWLF